MDTIYNLIAFFTLIASGILLYLFLSKKIPILLETEGTEIDKEKIKLELKEKILHFHPFKNFAIMNFLEKFLVKIRKWIIQLGTKTNTALKKIEEKQQIQIDDTVFSADYWKELKEKNTRKRKKLTDDQDLSKISKD